MLPQSSLKPYCVLYAFMDSSCLCLLCLLYICSNAENTPHVCSLDDQLVDSKQRRWGRSSFHSRSSSATDHDDEASHKGRGGAHSTTSPKQSKLRTGKQPHSRYVYIGVYALHISAVMIKTDTNNACMHIYASYCGEGR